MPTNIFGYGILIAITFVLGSVAWNVATSEPTPPPAPEVKPVTRPFLCEDFAHLLDPEYYGEFEVYVCIRPTL